MQKTRHSPVLGIGMDLATERQGQDPHLSPRGTGWAGDSIRSRRQQGLQRRDPWGLCLPFLSFTQAGRVGPHPPGNLNGTSRSVGSPLCLSLSSWALPLGWEKAQVPQRPDKQMGLWVGTSQPTSSSPPCPWAGGQLNPGGYKEALSRAGLLYQRLGRGLLLPVLGVQGASVGWSWLLCYLGQPNTAQGLGVLAVAPS